MKVAIVHDWLNEKVGGAENVLLELTKMYPTADIFTLVYNPQKFAQFLADRKVYTSKLNHFPKYFKRNPQLLLPFIKSAVNKWHFADYDLVITSSTAWVKNINIGSTTRHICYCHSPARMLWDSWPKYLEKFKLGPLTRYYIIHLTSKLRLWDYYQSQNNTVFIANSNYIARRIAKFYRKKSKVIYPPVKLIGKSKVSKKEDFFLIVSVIAKYKNIELAIKAFLSNGKKLVIAGEGPDLERLKNLASDASNIVFKGRVTDQEKLELYRKARGFIFCSIEDFGITMVESISAGTPVLALRGGGALESIDEGLTGMFFDQPTESSLNKAIEKFESKFPASKELIMPDLTKYQSTRFSSEIRKIVQG